MPQTLFGRHDNGSHPTRQPRRAHRRCRGAGDAGRSRLAGHVVAAGTLTDEDLKTALRRSYRRFARYEARGVSPLYEELTQAVAGHDGVLSFLSELPPAKRQPNLLLAAYRLVAGVPASGLEFCERITADPAPIRQVMLARRTQTNEPARCAVLLPLLAALPQPLALIEVGASAGLCLFPDCYAYIYDRGDTIHRLAPVGSESSPIFRCKANAATPLPPRLPTVCWRRGIDLNPLDLKNPDDVGWLEALVWPEQVARLKNLRDAIPIVRSNNPSIIRGDLLEGLPGLVAEAPDKATIVVFHSAVLGYVRKAESRARFRDLVRSLDVVWISNERAQVFPDVEARLPNAPPRDRLLLSIDGDPKAATGPHGQSIDWFGPGPA